MDGVARDSPLGPLMAYAFMCSIEEQSKEQNKMSGFYKRYVDDTLSKMPSASAASEFLVTLNGSHPSISFTMDLEDNDKLPLLGIENNRNGPRLDTKVYKKPIDTGYYYTVGVLNTRHLARKKFPFDRDLSRQINTDIRPAYTSRGTKKIGYWSSARRTIWNGTGRYCTKR